MPTTEPRNLQSNFDKLPLADSLLTNEVIFREDVEHPVNAHSKAGNGASESGGRRCAIAEKTQTEEPGDTADSAPEGAAESTPESEAE